MAQLGLFRRLSAPNLSCFYCLSPVAPNSSATFDPSCFRCPHCGCLNRYDERGQIIGDHPAMYQEDLNQESFSRRGAPDRNHFPSTSQKSPFCHACQTNQTLLINLRAAYLPAPDDPSYASRVAQLPTYITSLQHRYPPVCANCAPAVEAEIHQKDEYARTRALGGALKYSARTRVRSNNGPLPQKKIRESLLVWKLRGGLWAATCFASIAVLGVGGLKPQLFLPLRSLASYLPFLIGLSFLWTFWDPTYSSRRRAELNGRKMRIDGLFRYRVCQGLAWLNRLIFSILIASSRTQSLWSDPPMARLMQNSLLTSCIVEISLLIISYLSIHIRRPAPIRLIDSSAHRALSELSNSPQNTPSTAHTSLPEQDHFATLSLNGNPIISPSTGTNPMFGLSSLAPAPNIATSRPDPSSSARPNARPGTGAYDALDALFEPTHPVDDSFAAEGDDDEDEDGHGDRAGAGLLARTRAGRQQRRRRERDPDAMDWEPSSPAARSDSAARERGRKPKGGDDGTWMRSQRFFPPEEPTGLESLFMRTRLVDEDEQLAKGAADLRKGEREVKWGVVYCVSAIPVVGLLAGLWLWA